MKKFAQVILFAVYTWFIANSLLFAMGIVFYEKLTPEFVWRYFVLTFTQFGICEFFFQFPWNLSEILLASITLFYDFVLLFFPVRLFWRKHSIYHACLVALAGSFMPPYIAYGLFRGSIYILYSLPVMGAGYYLAWLISHKIIKKRCSHGDQRLE